MTPDYQSVDASANPDLAAAVIEKALTSAPKQEEKAPSPTLGATPDTVIPLPAGFETSDGDLINEAEVRELNGSDEEALAKANTLGKFIDTLLNRGVVRVGDAKPNRTTFDKMLAGDLDAMLLGIRVATFGPDVDFDKFACPDCEAEISVKVDLRSDVPSRPLEDTDDAEFEVALPSGTSVLVALPNGRSQRELASSTERTEAALKSLLLANCVQEINGLPVGAEQIRGLSVRDRNALMEEINKRNPGPRLVEVSKSCPECGTNIPLPLTLTDLFRF